MREEIKKRYLQVTPSGAYYATVNSQPDDARALLLQLMSSDIPIEFSLELFAELADLEKELAGVLFNRLIARRFLALMPEPIIPRQDSLEATLAEILLTLSSTGKVVLGDDQGFCLGSSGFDRDHADALAALAADIISLHQRHQLLLNKELELMGDSWGLLDPVGNSMLGIWIIHIGSQLFAVVIHGQPNLNQHQYVELISALTSRYLDK
ncbi:hypothetical protein [Neptunomonas antarctica]|uniref:Roadblock/LC7 domain-containing protein n=1 Tax=Neptunomonas antarctica TaxID=619304 RepID=A0A1N7NFN4_9GAMM|nr:hypothetical protein [Neptunomonas antarctica]SIS96989.1 hypothetical protein SAMN05421760_10978 [Neptunomonas antarctica]